jgi:hypothetical protein
MEDAIKVAGYHEIWANGREAKMRLVPVIIEDSERW